jgi:hypothetical protein
VVRVPGCVNIRGAIPLSDTYILLHVPTFVYESATMIP